MIVLLFQKLNLKSSNGQEHDQEKLKKEIEALLVTYTLEMKEENEKLVNKIVSKQKTAEQQQTNSIKTYEKKPSPKANRNEGAFSKRPLLEAEEIEEFVPPIIEGTADVVEQSKTAQVLSLANQGLSPKEIAKRLSMGDGEVELLLKFHK